MLFEILLLLIFSSFFVSLSFFPSHERDTLNKVTKVYSNTYAELCITYELQKYSNSQWIYIIPVVPVFAVISHLNIFYEFHYFTVILCLSAACLIHRPCPHLLNTIRTP